MKIKVAGPPYHNVYGANGMSGKIKYGFEQLGHRIIEDDGEDLYIIPGAAANFKDAPITGKKIFWNHGVHWFRGFESPNNDILKDNFENCDAIAYQSNFARHMTEKAFGDKDGPYILNAEIPDFPEIPIAWKE